MNVLLEPISGASEVEDEEELGFLTTVSDIDLLKTLNYLFKQKYSVEKSSIPTRYQTVPWEFICVPLTLLYPRVKHCTLSMLYFFVLIQNLLALQKPQCTHNQMFKSPKVYSTSSVLEHC
jgi:hypothetical protein